MNFKLSKSADVVGICYQDCFNTSYKVLKKLFGESMTTDGYKVSTKWVFESDQGEVVTLYDYKETHLYDSSCPSVQEFRKEKSYDWHIGAKNKAIAKEFIDFLEKKLKKLIKN